MFAVEIKIESRMTSAPSNSAALKLPQPESVAWNRVCLLGLETNASPPSRQFTFRANTSSDVHHFRLSIANSILSLIKCLSQAINKLYHNFLLIQQASRYHSPFRFFKWFSIKKKTRIVFASFWICLQFSYF